MVMFNNHYYKITFLSLSFYELTTPEHNLMHACHSIIIFSLAGHIILQLAPQNIAVDSIPYIG